MWTAARAGHHLPTLKAITATRRLRDALAQTRYGRQVLPPAFGRIDLWYGAQRDQPGRTVIVRDPGGRRPDEAFSFTDLTVDHRLAIPGQPQFLGFEDPRHKTAEAVARTAPVVGLFYDRLGLRCAARLQQGLASG